MLMNEGNYIRGMRWVVIGSSVILLVLILTAWIKEGLFRDWKSYQREYIDLLDEIDSLSDIEMVESREVYQVNLEDLGRIDRCVSCHNGLENPSMAGFPQPHKIHPGDHLKHHPIAKFGCTVCHGGQGRALEMHEAFGRDPRFHWPFPLLSQPYIQASCGKCHLAIYSESQQFEGTDIFNSGKEIFRQEGCLGCHKARGVGGILGPDLTEQGEKTKHEYSFQNIAGDQTISNWLKEHFRDPEMVSPGSQMLRIDLPDEDLDALVTFVLGLAKPDIPFEYFSVEALREFKGNRNLLPGNKIFSFSCSACHGKNGEGKDFNQFIMGVPGILNPDFLRMVSEDYIQFTLRKGRSDRQMASWAPVLSGWKDKEIDSIVVFFSDRTRKSQIRNNQLLEEGDIENGERFFETNCVMCHGSDGRGGIALAINSDAFLPVASDRFIIQTILYGRNNTAMPSWYDMNPQQQADLLAYIRCWNTKQGRDFQVNLPTGNIQIGALNYHYLCSRCHGEFGEGDTGPSILNRNFLGAVSNAYLYETIANGRSYTAMFGWSEDVHGDERLDKQDISNILEFMRSTIDQELTYIHAGANPGDASTGQKLFQSNCAVCHGEFGEGENAPALNNQELLSAASNGYLLGTISLGRSETAMPSWGRGEENYSALSGKERQDIVAYIRNWQRIRIRYD